MYQVAAYALIRAGRRPRAEGAADIDQPGSDEEKQTRQQQDTAEEGLGEGLEVVIDALDFAQLGRLDSPKRVDQNAHATQQTQESQRRQKDDGKPASAT